MNPADYAVIIKGICSNLSIDPDDTLMLNVMQFCRKKNLNQMRSEASSQEELNQRLVELYLKYLSRDSERAEMKMIKDRALAEHKKPVKRTQNSIIGPLSQWVNRSMHIDIDSMNRNVSEDRGNYLTDFRFVLSTRNDRAPLGTGIIPARIVPTNITYMKIGKIILPYNSTLSALNYTRELTLSFTGLRSNGAIAAHLNTNETIHFSFTYTVCSFNAGLVELTPVNKYCKFDPPLTYLDNMSIRFNEPRYVAQFNKDRLIPTAFDYGSSNGVISFGENHNLNNDDIIIVTGLTTLDDGSNSTLLNAINNTRGIKIASIDATSISTGLDFTTIVDPDTSSLPLVIFVSKTFRFMLEVGYGDSDEEFSSKSNPYRR